MALRASAAMIVGRSLHVLPSQHDRAHTVTLPPGFTQAHVANGLSTVKGTGHLVLITDTPANGSIALWNGQRETRVALGTLGSQLSTNISVASVSHALTARFRSLRLVGAHETFGLMMVEDDSQNGGTVRWYIISAEAVQTVPVAYMGNTDPEMHLPLDRPLSHAELLLGDILERLAETHSELHQMFLWSRTPLQGWLLGPHGVFWRTRRSVCPAHIVESSAEVLCGASLIGLGKLILAD